MALGIYTPGDPDEEAQNAEAVDRLRALTLRDSPEIRQITDSMRSRMAGVLRLHGVTGVPPITETIPDTVRQAVLQLIDAQPDGNVKDHMMREVALHIDSLDQALTVPATSSTPAATPSNPSTIPAQAGTEGLQRFLDLKENDPALDVQQIKDRVRMSINAILIEDDVKNAKYSRNMPPISVGISQEASKLGKRDVMMLRNSLSLKGFQSTVSVLLQNVEEGTRDKILSVLATELTASAPASTVVPTAPNTLPSVAVPPQPRTVLGTARNVAGTGLSIAGNGLNMAGNAIGSGYGSLARSSVGQWSHNFFSVDPQRSWKQFGKDFVSPKAYWNNFKIFKSIGHIGKILSVSVGPSNGAVWRWTNNLLTWKYNPLSWINPSSSNFFLRSSDSTQKS